MEFEEQIYQGASQYIEEEGQLHYKPGWQFETILFFLPCDVGINSPGNDS